MPGASKANEAWLKLSLPRICSWNASALFASDQSLMRQRLSVLKKLLTGADVLTVQEAHLDATLVLPSILTATFSTYSSPHSNGKSTGGLLTFVRRSWLADGNCELHVEWPGRIMQLHFSWP
eukprot:6454976-Amphidinium_carterae.2